MLGVQAAVCAAPLQRRCLRARSPQAGARLCVAQAKQTPPSGPGGAPKKPAQPSRGPGAAPLRMQTEDQKKFGYGGDNCASSAQRRSAAAHGCMRHAAPRPRADARRLWGVAQTTAVGAATTTAGSPEAATRGCALRCGGRTAAACVASRASQRRPQPCSTRRVAAALTQCRALHTVACATGQPGGPRHPSGVRPVGILGVQAPGRQAQPQPQPLCVGALGAGALRQLGGVTQ
jgi:hypothetical protein